MWYFNIHKQVGEYNPSFLLFFFFLNKKLVLQGSSGNMASLNLQDVVYIHCFFFSSSVCKKFSC